MNHSPEKGEKERKVVMSEWVGGREGEVSLVAPHPLPKKVGCSRLGEGVWWGCGGGVVGVGGGSK